MYMIQMQSNAQRFKLMGPGVLVPELGMMVEIAVSAADLIIGNDGALFAELIEDFEIVVRTPRTAMQAQKRRLSAAQVARNPVVGFVSKKRDCSFRNLCHWFSSFQAGIP